MNYKRIAITFLTVISSIIAVFYAGYNYILPFYLSYKLFDVSNSSNADVIGGADAPTTIFVSHFHMTGFIALFFTVLSVFGITYLITTRNIRLVKVKRH